MDYLYFKAALFTFKSVLECGVSALINRVDR